MSVAAIVASDAALVAAVAAALLTPTRIPPPAAPAPAGPKPLVETLDADEVRRRIQEGSANLTEVEPAVPGVADLPVEELRGVLEAMLLVATKPLEPTRLAELLPGAHPAHIDGFLMGLSERFTRERRGWDLRRLAGGWQLLTRPEFHSWVRQLDRRELPDHLTKSGLETLAIVAYKQPVTRGTIEDIRGVQSGPMLRQLMDMKLVRVVGRDESALGQPLLYGTTTQFLERFGLGSLEELPRRHEFGA